MAEKNKIPEIRFKGFSGEWDAKELGDISESFEYGLNAAATEFDGKNKYIRITDINEDSHLFNVNGLTSPNTDLNLAENYKLNLGDILFARTGASVGKTYIYKAKDGLVYFAGFLIRARIKQEVNAEFIFQNTLTEKYNKFVRLTSQRSGQPGINAQEYSNYDITIPSKTEQTKIGNYFQQLDTLITLHQDKHDKLLNVKKAMLEKMFPKKGADVPEIRFKGFSEKWEERSLGERKIATVKTGYPFDSNNFDDNGEYLVITNGNIQNKSSFVDNSLGNRIDIENNSMYSEYVLNPNDILITMDGTVGRVAKVVEHRQILAQRVGRLTATAEPEFLYQCLNTGTFFKKMTLIAHGGTIKHVSLTEICSYEFCIPTCIKEQTKIGNFFKNLDTLLTLHQTELEKLKNIKKSCLEKMFV